MIAGAHPAARPVLADRSSRGLFVDRVAEALRQGDRRAALATTLLAPPWGFRLEEVMMPVSIWQGLADNIVPAAMVRRPPLSVLHWVPGEGHLSLIVRRLDVVLADL